MQIPKSLLSHWIAIDNNKLYLHDSNNVLQYYKSNMKLIIDSFLINI